jgi:hypothetical protein
LISLVLLKLELVLEIYVVQERIVIPWRLFGLSFGCGFCDAQISEAVELVEVEDGHVLFVFGKEVFRVVGFFQHF